MHAADLKIKEKVIFNITVKVTYIMVIDFLAFHNEHNLSWESMHQYLQSHYKTKKLWGFFLILFFSCEFVLFPCILNYLAVPGRFAVFTLEVKTDYNK